MAYKKVKEESLVAVADAIREQTGKTDTIAFPNGFASAPAELVEVGRQKEWSDFWDAYQQNGTRDDYSYAFAGTAWTNDLFKPKYLIKPYNAMRMFNASTLTFDESLNDVIDFSNNRNFYDAFRGIVGTVFGLTVDLSMATNINAMFYGSTFTTIKRVIFSESTKNTGAPFQNCTNLVNLGAEGTIACTISFQWCPLSLESAKAVINCLKNFTGTGLENTTTITFHATTWGYLDAEGNAAPDGTPWREYIGNTLCWNC